MAKSQRPVVMDKLSSSVHRKDNGVPKNAHITFTIIGNLPNTTTYSKWNTEKETLLTLDNVFYEHNLLLITKMSQHIKQKSHTKRNTRHPQSSTITLHKVSPPQDISHLTLQIHNCNLD